MLRTVLVISAVIGFSTVRARVRGSPRTRCIAVIVLAVVLVAAAAANRTFFGSWLRPGWAWGLRGTGRFLEAWRASKSWNQTLLEYSSSSDWSPTT